MTSLAAETRSILQAYGLQPRKALGQNFLADRDVLEDIVRAAGVGAGDAVIEVGPGVGTLTAALLESGAEVTAVELDERLAAVVRSRLVENVRLRVVEANILHVDMATILPASGRYNVVANIPYYITAPIIRLFLEEETPPDVMVLMVQREVAERLAAAPGRLSILGVMAQYYAQVEIVQIVPASAFVPPPEVDSAVVRLRPYRTTLLPREDADRFFALVKAGFGEKRKQIHNALVRGLAHIPAADIDAALADAHIDRVRRAETVSLEEWGALYGALEPRLPSRPRSDRRTSALPPIKVRGGR